MKLELLASTQPCLQISWSIFPSLMKSFFEPWWSQFEVRDTRATSPKREIPIWRLGIAAIRFCPRERSAAPLINQAGGVRARALEQLTQPFWTPGTRGLLTITRSDAVYGPHRKPNVPLSQYIFDVYCGTHGWRWVCGIDMPCGFLLWPTPRGDPYPPITALIYPQQFCLGDQLLEIRSEIINASYLFSASSKHFIPNNTWGTGFQHHTKAMRRHLF